MYWLLDIVINFDKYLEVVLDEFGLWTYLILFLIIFFETGIVIMPFLPGDSLLFALGALAAHGHLELFVLIILLIPAAIIGDAVNYSIGYRVGPKIFAKDNVRFLNKKHLLNPICLDKYCLHLLAL